MPPLGRLDDREQPIIRIEGVSKSFGGFPAVVDVSLDIARGDFFCLVGASGSGKTTLLRLLAGFEAPERGRVLIGGEDMTGRPPYERPVNMMFQSYALFPHLSVQNNVAFGLQEERLPKAQITEGVAAALDLFDMGALAARKPHQLSGGQRQRVALARALGAAQGRLGHLGAQRLDQGPIVRRVAGEGLAGRIDNGVQLRHERRLAFSTLPRKPEFFGP